MTTFSKTATKPNYLFGTLPHFFKENDNYVPNTVVGYESDGLLERYLEAFCLELDDEVTPYLGSLTYLWDAIGLNNLPGSEPDKFLIHLSDIMLNPPNVGSSDMYKILIRYIREILQVRGTRLSLDLYLALLGYKVSSITSTPIESPLYDKTPTPDIFDNNLIYDSFRIYYFHIDLVITDYDGIVNTTPSSEWLANLELALENFIFPIFSEIDSITYI